MPNLRDLRRQADLTQAELAERSGLRQATISSLENGLTRAQSASVSSLSDALGIDPSTVRAALNEPSSPPTTMDPLPTANPTPDSPVSAKVVNIDREAFDPGQLGELAWNWQSAQRATEKHARQWKEAMAFLDPILKHHPEFLEARMLMRQAELEAELKIPLGDRIPPPHSYIGRAHKLVEAGDPLAAIEMLEEKVFVYLPTNAKAAFALYEAAMAADLPKTALFALEFAAAHNRDDKEVYRRLADHHSRSGNLGKACAIFKRVTEIDPTDADAKRAYKNLVATASMGDGSIKAKDRDGAIALERSRDRGLTEGQKRDEIERILAIDEADAEALSQMRRAVQFARELGESSLPDLQQAFEIQQRLVDTFPGDPQLLTELDDLQIQVRERELAEAEAALATVDSSAGNDSLAEKVEHLRSASIEAKLEVAERAAHANPTNGEAQLNLGRALIDAGRHREAVKPLQRAKKDPRSGNDIEAMSLLADCFNAGNLQDLAAAELEAAIDKIAADATRDTDQQWKELSYKKARLLLNQERGDDAQAIFAAIYAKDSDFRDVEHRVWGG